MKRFSILVAALAVASTLSSCKKEEDNNDDSNNSGTATVVVDFDYVWAMSGQPFVMNQALYHPMSGDTLSFTTFKHYISNVKLVKSDNSTWDATESYHLLDLSDDATTAVTFTDVPTGNYTGIEITFGVDSLRNVSGAQTGALDPANGMFWSWNSGYIMIKAEGTSPQSASGPFGYHLGGFQGTNNVVVTRTFSFPNSATYSLDKDETMTVKMLANPARLWHTYGSVSNGETIHMPGTEATQMAEDFNTWTMLDEVF